jgi:hypothetical protein
MKNILKLSAVALIAAASIVACKKYEEGPSMSLRSKKGRVAGTWTVEKATSNGTDMTSFYSGFEMTFEKDGTYSSKFGSNTTTGTWEFIDSKEAIKMTYTSGNQSVSDTTHLTRLTNKEMWSKETDGSDVFEMHLKAK